MCVLRATTSLPYNTARDSALINRVPSLNKVQRMVYESIEVFFRRCRNWTRCFSLTGKFVQQNGQLAHLPSSWPTSVLNFSAHFGHSIVITVSPLISANVMLRVRRFLSKRTPARIKTVPKSSAIVAFNERLHISCRRETRCDVWKKR